MLFLLTAFALESKCKNTKNNQTGKIKTRIVEKEVGKHQVPPPHHPATFPTFLTILQLYFNHRLTIMNGNTMVEVWLKYGRSMVEIT